MSNVGEVYNEYIERHKLEKQDDRDDIFATLTRLMEGNEQSSELGRELLEIWKNLKESDSDNEQYFDLNNINDERQKRLLLVRVKESLSLT